MIKVVIVDDHRMIVKGLKVMLSENKLIDIISTFYNGKELLEFLTHTLPEVLLLDINLPDIDGLELCKIINKEYPTIKIVALTNYNEVSFVKNMIKNGAKGYLLKNTSKEEIILAVQSAMRDELYLPETIKEQILNEGFGVKSRSFIPKLTRREREVLNAIADELTSSEIAKRLFISIKTVESHRNNLLQKFDVRNTAGLIKKAFVMGLLD